MLTPLSLATDWVVPEADRITGTPYMKRGRKATKLIVIHWTACPLSTPDDDNYSRIRRWLSGQGSKSSTHFCILRSGRVLQAVSLMDSSWNAGDSSWTPADSKKIKTSVNQYSIGIDLDNIGPLTRRKDGSLVDCYGGTWTGRVAMASDGKLYEPYTEEQVEAARELVAFLAPIYGISPCDIVGHVDVSPGRKIDPGPLWNMTTIRMPVMKRVWRSLMEVPSDE